MKNENVWQLENIADEIDRLEWERNEWRRRYLELRNEIKCKMEELQRATRRGTTSFEESFAGTENDQYTEVTSDTGGYEHITEKE